MSIGVEKSPEEVRSSEEKVVPVCYKRVGSDKHDDGEYPPHYERFNWLYKCICGEVVDRWKKECPTCASKFLWKNVKILVSATSNQETDIDEQRENVI